MTPVLHFYIYPCTLHGTRFNKSLPLHMQRKAYFTALALIYLSHCSFIHSSFSEHLLY